MSSDKAIPDIFLIYTSTLFQAENTFIRLNTAQPYVTQVEQDGWLGVYLVKAKQKFHTDLPVEWNFIWQNTYTL